MIESLTNCLKKSIPSILIGNKKDLEKERKIDTKKARDFAILNELEYFETSAKTGENVELVFDKLAKLLITHKAKTLITT